MPGLDLDERKVSRSISRVLETVKAEPRLSPADPERRDAVEEAERWGEEELQETVRRIFRWAAAYQQPVRRWLAELAGVPAPGLTGALNAPLARRFARRSGADERRVRDAIAQLPSMLDHVDRLIASGVIGSPDPNAADFQIGSSVRVVTMPAPSTQASARARSGTIVSTVDPHLGMFRTSPDPTPAFASVSFVIAGSLELAARSDYPR